MYARLPRNARSQQSTPSHPSSHFPIHYRLLIVGIFLLLAFEIYWIPRLIDQSRHPHPLDDGTVKQELTASPPTDRYALQDVLDALMYWKRPACVPVPGPPLFNISTEEKFVTFEPDFGGWNNIRMGFETAILVAFVTERTLVLPPRQQMYLLHGKSDFREYFDIEDMKSHLRVLSTHEYLRAIGLPEDHPAFGNDVDAVKNFLRNDEQSYNLTWSPDTHVWVIPDKDAVKDREIPTLDAFTLSGDRPIVTYDAEMQSMRSLHFPMEYPNYRLFGNFGAMPFFANREYQDYYFAKIRDSVHLHPNIVWRAGRVVHRILNSVGPYNAVHIRRGDLQYKEVKIPISTVAKYLSSIFEPQYPLYISTDVQNKKEMEPLTGISSKLLFLEDYQDESITEAPNRFIGQFEMVICSGSRRFAGTPMSTFTSYINRLRLYQFYHHPDAPPPIQLIEDPNIYYNTKSYPTVPDTHDTNATWLRFRDWPVAQGPRWEKEYFWSWNFVSGRSDGPRSLSLDIP